MLGTWKKTLIASASVAISVCGAAAAQDTDVDLGADGFTFESGIVKLNVGGRIHVDTVSVESDGIAYSDETDIRRLRIDATLDVGKDWRFKIDGDVGGLSPGIYNAWIAYRGIKETEIRYVQPGFSVAIKIDAYPDREFNGTVLRVGQSATSQFSLLPNTNPSGNFTKVTQRLPVKISIEQSYLKNLSKISGARYHRVLM